MSLSSLQALGSSRQDLLLAEIAALLHDLGKFTDIHIEHHAVNSCRKWSNDYAYKVVVDEPASVIRLSRMADAIKKPDILNKVRSARSPKAADFLSQSLKDGLQLGVSVLNQKYSLAELIMLGVPGFAAHDQRGKLLDGKDGWLPAVLGLCHHVAHADKQDPIRGEQSLPNVLTSNAFGYEQVTFVIGDPQTSLDARLQTLSLNQSNLSDTRKQILKTFQYGLGDTRRPINEVTLADWAAIVAALFKAALSGAILTNTQPQIRQWDNKAKIIDHDFRWRILRVNFDVLALYAKAVKIADLLGYQRAIDQACEQVKSLIEEEYPLGNEVYRDSTGIYFTFPDLDLFTDLAQEIRRLLEQVEPELSPRIAVTVGDGQKAAEQLKGILAKARCEALRDLGQPFDTANFTSYWQQLWENPGLEQNWELCPVCRLRPMSEGNEACEHCLKRRGSRVKEWQSDPRYTIWIDELADANGRVALLVGKFGLEDWLSGELVQTLLVAAKANEPIGCVPKNPSPARLRRIWETCQRFWMDTVENQILNGLPDRTRWLLEVEQKASLPPPGVVCDGTFNGDPISVWHFGDAFLTISFVPEQPKPGLLSLTREDDGRKSQVQYRVRRVVAPSKQYSRYRPILTMLASPDQFLAFVPAADALEIVEQIRGEYEKQFGKVQNRLPLFFGIVFFPRKMPLVAVIDAAQRMLETPLVMEEWRVEYCCPDSQGLDQHVSLSRGGERIFWKIATKMGDNQTDDLWYPYFFVIHFADGTPDDRSYRFQHNGHWLVHVKELKEGDVVSIAPSRFAYLWLDHTAKRFEFDPQRDAMLLSELSHLSKMWDGIRSIPEMTDTQLHDISALFEVKSTLWQRESREFQNLVHATLKRAGMLDVISIEDVSSGRFVRCLELYVRILKRKIKN